MKTREQNEVARAASGVSPPAWRRAWLMLTKVSQMLNRFFANLFHLPHRRFASSVSCARVRIYDALREAGADGATFEEIERASGLNANTVRGRLSELAARGLATASERRRPVSSGRDAVVYLAVPELPFAAGQAVRAGE